MLVPAAAEIRPRSTTTIRSELIAVARRCAITSVVRLHEPPERFPHQPLALGVQRAGGLVQQQDRRILEDRPRDGDALLLPARQPRTAFA